MLASAPCAACTALLRRESFAAVGNFAYSTEKELPMDTNAAGRAQDEAHKITATMVPEGYRLGFLPRHFESRMLEVEALSTTTSVRWLRRTKAATGSLWICRTEAPSCTCLSGASAGWLETAGIFGRASLAGKTRRTRLPGRWASSAAFNGRKSVSEAITFK